MQRFLARFFAAVLVVLMGAATPLRAEVAVPPLTQPVTDLTGTLSVADRAELNQRLQTLSQQSGSQVAVLIVPTTQPEAIEQYSIRVVDLWKLGRKGIDDGALLLVAKNDRAVRIEVGRGLEGAIPDAIAKRIVEEIIIPEFKAGRFNAGISAGVNTIIGLVRGEQLPEPKRGGGSDFLIILLLVAALILLNAILPASSVSYRTYRGGSRRSWGGGVGRGGFGGGGFSGGGGGFSGGGASGRW